MPDLTWSHLVQYDSVSGSIGFNSRLRWEYRPGQRVYLVLNQSYRPESTGLRLAGNEVVLKVLTTFRF
ncbi:MAG: hypothetical protein FJ387_01505 [Verrucomicrobia bacterium]|nr:hypothetical protein [Verrucomicrobiota bacterium]